MASRLRVAGRSGPGGCSQPGDVPQWTPDVTGAFQVMAQRQALDPRPLAALAHPGPGVVGMWVGRAVASGHGCL